MKRTELRRKTPLSRGVRKLANVARRKRKQYRKDMEWRKEFLELHPWCEIGPVLMGVADLRPVSVGANWIYKHPCKLLATELHERIKRSRGGSTTDANNVMPACRPCHEFTEAHPAEATKLGLLQSNPDWKGK